MRRTINSHGLSGIGVCGNPSACTGLYTDQNAWMVAIGSKLTAANAAYNLTHRQVDATTGQIIEEDNLTLAQAFAAAGLSDAEIACWISNSSAFLPELVEYNQESGCGGSLATSPSGSPLGTNYPAPGAAPVTQASTLAQIDAAVAQSQAAAAAVASGSSTTPGMMPGETQAIPTPTPASSAPAPAPASTACVVGDATWALFGDTSCFTIGSTSIGTTTALVLGAAAIALLMFFGGKK